ncbi:MAG: M15 family metallopeptidase [Muribaculum sp.]|nr:M15 family metallopeptidase [Muribaculum sp.]
MNLIDRNKLLKSLGILLLLILFVSGATFLHKKNSMTLTEYAQQHTGQPSDSGQLADSSMGDIGNGNGSMGGIGNGNGSITGVSDSDISAGNIGAGDINGGNISAGDISGGNGSTGNAAEPATMLTGALLNGGVDGQAQLAERVTYMPASGAAAEDFYYEPLSESLQRYITGISYPASNGDASQELAISYSDLRYVHILHYDFNGEATEGELICNKAIAADLLDIFYELYYNEYQLERVRLIDEYDGDDTASMEDNNTSCFNYRVVEGTDDLSKHALGLALDINPFYNPYVTYENGVTRISPVGSEGYANRKAEFPYKIDEDDLCYKLFIQHGFTWGGNWNSLKDYQHFQKTK